MKLKAYCVYPGRDPADEGCLLVFAPTRGKARGFALRNWPGLYLEFTDFKAVRRQTWDKYAIKDGIHLIMDNSGLPNGAPKFYDEEV
jgi:hypothetical protein